MGHSDRQALARGRGHSAPRQPAMDERAGLDWPPKVPSRLSWEPHAVPEPCLSSPHHGGGGLRHGSPLTPSARPPRSYFGFITKHPLLSRFACHVFVSQESMRPVAQSVG